MVATEGKEGRDKAGVQQPQSSVERHLLEAYTADDLVNAIEKQYGCENQGHMT